VKDWVLDYNGIETRHYAIDPETGKPTHTNAQMTAEAVRRLLERTHMSADEIQCLVCGTSSADQVIPSHAAMVHGELGCTPCELVSTTGVCCSGMSAFKYGYMNVLSGLTENAITTGSELASISFRASRFTPQVERAVNEFNQEPMLAFENEFLRWMLSDGAGAVLISDSPSDDSLSLRVDWIELKSYANSAETCMYFGGVKTADGGLESFRGIDDPMDLVGGGYLSLGQDVRVLRENLPRTVREIYLASQEKHALEPQEVDWFLPHYSSEGFREPLQQGLTEVDCDIPVDRWFTNLKSKGNTGSASIYIIRKSFSIRGGRNRRERVVRRNERLRLSAVRLFSGNDPHVLDGLRNGRSGVELVEEYKELGFRSALAGTLKDFEAPDLDRVYKRQMGRNGLIAMSAALEAIADARLEDSLIRTPRCGVIIGNSGPYEETYQLVHQKHILKKKLTSFALPRAMASTVSANMSVALGTQGHCMTVSTAGSGAATALTLAAQTIRVGLQDQIISGGVHLDHPTAASRPFHRDRDGLVPATAAGILVLENYDVAVNRGAPIYGEIIGYASNSDGAEMTTPSGEGSVRCMKLALEDAGVSPDEVDYINAHATGTQLGDTVEAQGIASVFGDRPYVSATKSMTGHEVAAAGATELIYTLLMMKHEFIAPTINLDAIDDACACIRHATARMKIASDVQRELDDLGADRDKPHVSVLKAPVFRNRSYNSVPPERGIAIMKTGEHETSFNIMTVYDVLCYDSLLAFHEEGKEDEVRQKLDGLLEKIGGTTRQIDNIAFPLACRKNTAPRQTLHRNPYDYQHFRAIYEFYPTAKFVFLHRHPLRILNSQLKALQSISASMPPYYALTRISQMRPMRRRVFQSARVWKFINGLVDPNSKRAWGQRLLVSQIVANGRYYFRNKDAVPSANSVSIRYEDLCTAPNETMSKMLEFLGVPFPEGTDFTEEIAPRPARYVPTIDRDREKLLQKFSELIEGHNYQPGDDEM
ncbi:3-oxoacyl-[acyl-carrier-protein] synthase 1 (3-oxoacyl-[acyl-carrier-protein] synthase I) (Beta-ketoacyl-ACP synthase I) (KAS I), partial [Durusdinium trenchii]